MLNRTIKKLGETFDALRKDLDDATADDPRAKTGEMFSKQGPFTVKIKDSCVEITGPIKELKINGKLVRFPGGLP